MVLTRRNLLAAGGIAGGVTAAQSLVGALQPAAAVTTSRSAFSVKDTSYGVTTGVTAAVGNGSTNDTAAIQDHLNVVAIYGGGNVYFPIGTYLVTSTITVPKGVNIVCEGNAILGELSQFNANVNGTVTLLGDTGFSGTILQTVANTGTDHRGNIISNLRVAGKTAATSTTPSAVFNAGSNGAGTRVEGCAFWRGGHEVVLWSGNGVFINNFVYGHTAGSIGLRITSPDSKFVGNDITAYDNCVQFDDGGAHNLFDGNLVYNSNTAAGIHVKGTSCNRNTFTGNRVDENATAGLLVEGSGNVMTGNAIVLNGVVSTGSPPPENRSGVRINSNFGNVVTGNVIANWDHSPGPANTQQYGVALTGNTNNHDNVITGNSFIHQILGSVFTGSGIGTGNITSGNGVSP